MRGKRIFCLCTLLLSTTNIICLSCCQLEDTLGEAAAHHEGDHRVGLLGTGCPRPT